ncbi:hypothetical protein ACQP1U_14390 [Actinomycetota bacterium]
MVVETRDPDQAQGDADERHQAFTWGEWDSAPFLWQIQPDAASARLEWFPGLATAPIWDEQRAMLEAVLPSLPSALGCVPEAWFAPVLAIRYEHPGRWVELVVSPEGCTVRVPTAAGPQDSHVRADPAVLRLAVGTIVDIIAQRGEDPADYERSLGGGTGIGCVTMVGDPGWEARSILDIPDGVPEQPDEAAASERRTLRLWAAGQPGLSPQAAARLASDPEVEVRRQLVRHPSDDVVRAAVEANADLRPLAIDAGRLTVDPAEVGEVGSRQEAEAIAEGPDPIPERIQIALVQALGDGPVLGRTVAKPGRLGVPALRTVAEMDVRASDSARAQLVILGEMPFAELGEEARARLASQMPEGDPRTPEWQLAIAQDDSEREWGPLSARTDLSDEAFDILVGHAAAGAPGLYVLGRDARCPRRVRDLLRQRGGGAWILRNPALEADELDARADDDPGFVRALVRHPELDDATRLRNLLDRGADMDGGLPGDSTEIAQVVAALGPLDPGQLRALARAGFAQARGLVARADRYDDPELWRILVVLARTSRTERSLLERPDVPEWAALMLARPARARAEYQAASLDDYADDPVRQGLRAAADTRGVLPGQVLSGADPLAAAVVARAVVFAGKEPAAAFIRSATTHPDWFVRACLLDNPYLPQGELRKAARTLMGDQDPVVRRLAGLRAR